MKTTKNRLFLDYADHPELQAALGGLTASDDFCLEFRMMVVSNDAKGIEGSIESIEYETPAADGDDKETGEVEPTAEDPVMVVITARNKRDEKKKSSVNKKEDEPDAED